MVDYSIVRDIYQNGVITGETVIIHHYWGQVSFRYNYSSDGIEIVNQSDKRVIGFFSRRNVEEMNALLLSDSGLKSETSDEPRNLEPLCESGQDTASEQR